MKLADRISLPAQTKIASKIVGGVIWMTTVGMEATRKTVHRRLVGLELISLVRRDTA